MKRTAEVMVVTALLSVTAFAVDGRGARWWADGGAYMVAADHEAASRAGAEILAKGGNAVDAAAAVSFALAVVRPESCGMGGGGFLILHRTGHRPVVLDYRETVPARADLTHYRDGKGKPIPDKTKRGAWAVGTPGQVKGQLLAFERYGSGKLSRKEILAPAIRLAREGVVVDGTLHRVLKNLAAACRKQPAYRQRFAELCRVFLNDGEPHAVGERIHRTDIATTLEAIARNGADAFYRGPIGSKIAAEIARRGGPLREEDLAGYTVRTLEPLRGVFGPYEIVAMPPPSSGGAVILQILNVLSAREKNIAKSCPATIGGSHRLVEAMKHAFADRAAFLGDRSPAVLADVQRMISQQRARAVAAGMDADKTKATTAYGLRAVPDDGGTSHFCVVDSRGWAVACTETINLAFGSYVMVPGTGIILNNEMDDFTVDAETPNALGLTQSERNLIAPGRRPLSSMSPTIVLKDGHVVMIAGASGGPRIITATLQTLLNVLVRQMEVNEAVATPRLHHQWLPDELRAEPGVSADVVEGLRRRGHVVKQSGGFGNVQAIHRRPDKWRGACDPRKGGKPAGR